jgi:hypothetical protein
MLIKRESWVCLHCEMDHGNSSLSLNASPSLSCAPQHAGKSPIWAYACLKPMPVVTLHHIGFAENKHSRHKKVKRRSTS